MKLKTDLDPIIAYGGISKYAGEVYAETHDAAVAHALLMAMDQWGTDEFGVVDALRARADELMAEWGYREE